VPEFAKKKTNLALTSWLAVDRNIYAFDIEFTEQRASAPTLFFCIMSSIKNVHAPYAQNLLNLLKSSRTAA